MDSTRHGDVTIAMQSEREGEKWTVREFILTQEKKERVVTQFQFTGWPDHGVPDNPGPVIDFVRTVRGQEDRDSTNRGPMLVHCRYNKLCATIYAYNQYSSTLIITKVNIKYHCMEP